MSLLISQADKIYSLQLLGLGIFTVLVASRPSLHRRGLVARVGMHLLAGFVFWREGTQNMQNAAMLDFGFAVVSAVALPFAGVRSGR